jgi:hypothetical protein
MRISRLVTLVALLATASAAVAQPVPPAEDDKALAARADALNDRAMQFHGAGRLAEAVPLAEEVLALRRRLYPEGHRDLATALN